MSEAKGKNIFDWIPVLIALILIICTFCFALIAVNLRPVAQWAHYQSACIEQESKKAPIEWAVRKCNGRSKVYQVK